MTKPNDIHDAILGRLEELRTIYPVLGFDGLPSHDWLALIDLAIACVKQRCPNCWDTGKGTEGVGPKDCPCNRHAFLAEVAEKLGIGGQK